MLYVVNKNSSTWLQSNISEKICNNYDDKKDSFLISDMFLASSLQLQKDK